MNVLVLSTSLRDEERSVSRRLVTRYLERLRAAHPEAVVRERDLVAAPVPHLPSEMALVQLGVVPAETVPLAALSEELIAELEATDLIVVGIAMYNFSISSSLKAWFDHVIRVRRTFAVVDGQYRGLLPPGKRVVALFASGGVYSEGPLHGLDIETNLRMLFGFMGIGDLTMIRAEGQALPDATTRVEQAFARIDAMP